MMGKILLVQGDAFHIPLQDASIHTVCTSPPYFGLQAYTGLAPLTFPGGSYCPVPGALPSACPAWDGHYGHEPAPSLYVWHTLLWLREVKRVLRDDGVAWVVIGDSYSASGKSGGGTQGDAWREYGPDHVGPRGGKWHTTPGYPQGSLLGIPQQVMLAAMGDGWVVRNDLVWHKVCPMPESVRGTRHEHTRCACPTARSAPPTQGSAQQNAHVSHDHSGDIRHKLDGYGRPDPACHVCHGTGRLEEVVLRRGSWRHTRAHETILMLTKGMSYWADGEAVREEPTQKPQRRSQGHSDFAGTKYTVFGHSGEKGVRDVPQRDCPVGGRNPRSVLTLAPSPYAGAHFATYPEDLIRDLIKATVPAQCCAVCGAGWAPVIERTPGTSEATHRPKQTHGMSSSKSTLSLSGNHGEGWHQRGARVTLQGYAPTCTCTTEASPIPGTVLDPFGGAGTTALVARALGCRGISLELGWPYLQQQRERLGLTDLHAWTHGVAPMRHDYTDLPLFTLEDHQ